MHLHLYTYRKTRMLLKNNRPHKIAIAIHSLSLIFACIFTAAFLVSEKDRSLAYEDYFLIFTATLSFVWFSLIGLPTAIISLRKNQKDPYRLIGLKNLFVQSFTVLSSLISTLISLLGIVTICTIGNLGYATLAVYVYTTWNSILALMLLPVSLIGCSLIWLRRRQIAKR